MPLEWKPRTASGRADTVCGKYQISIVTVRGQPRYTAFFVTGDMRAPFLNIGSRHHPALIKDLCQKHSDIMASKGE